MFRKNSHTIYIERFHNSLSPSCARPPVWTRTPSCTVTWLGIECGELMEHDPVKATPPARRGQAQGFSLIAHPRLRVWVTSERWVPTPVTIRGSHWLNHAQKCSLLIGIVHRWPAPVSVGGLLLYELPLAATPHSTGWQGPKVALASLPSAQCSSLKPSYEFYFWRALEFQPFSWRLGSNPSRPSMPLPSFVVDSPRKLYFHHFYYTNLAIKCVW